MGSVSPIMTLSVLPLLLFLAAQLQADHLVLRELTDYPLALCNDGTHATYHYTQGDIHNPYMMIYLKGGGACATEKSCHDRCKNGNSLCTADTSPTKDKDTTIWSTDPEENPPFHNFGKVYVDYCSSDVWSGTRSASAETGGYYFHGKHIVEAVVKDIIKNKPNIESVKQVVLIGTSAGAFGTNLNCDFVAYMFHEVNPGLDVRCIADSPDFYPTTVHTEDCDPYDFTEMAHQLWQAIGDQSCVDESPEGSRDCLILPSYYNFIETPAMVIAQYIDTTVHGACTPSLHEDQQFWDDWQLEAFSMANTYVEDKPMNGLFFSNCPFHVATGHEYSWSQMDVPLVNSEGSEVLRNIIKNWLSGDGNHQAMDMPLEKNPKCPNF